MTDDYKQAVKDVINLLMIQHEAANGSHNYWHFAANLVRAEFLSEEPVTVTPREWVGLTDEEVGRLTVFDGLHHVEVPILADFARAIEAKLKEKNT